MQSRYVGTMYGFVAEELDVTLSLRGRIMSLRKRTGIASSLALLLLENALISKRTYSVLIGVFTSNSERSETQGTYCRRNSRLLAIG
jgi:hypothetical protein